MPKPLIGIVGPCSAGKSALARKLRAAGHEVREIRQEHSVTPTMWQRFARPDILIYLDVNVDVAAQREGLTEPSTWWAEEREFRLAHAREHCDLYIDTSPLSPEAVLGRVQQFLLYWQSAPLPHVEGNNEFDDTHSLP